MDGGCVGRENQCGTSQAVLEIEVKKKNLGEF